MADDNHTQMLLQQQQQQQQATTQQSHMQQAQMQSPQVQQGQLQQSQVQQSQLQPSQLQHSQMQHSQIQQSQLQPTQIQPTQLQQAQMQSTQLQQAQIQSSHLQQAQIQPTQLQQTQIQPSQLQQSQIQPNQLQQSQIQPNQLQQSQMQPNQLQQSQIQPTQLQQAQIQQTQLQQTQIQQQQLQSQSAAIQQQPQVQAVAASMSLGSTVEQANMSVSTSLPINVATINASQPQQQMQNVNTSSGTAVQMAVPQLTAQAHTLSAGTMLSQSSGQHPTMMQPTMTMAQAPLQQVQVIQQPLSAYMQQLYTAPQQQMLFPGNLLQHAGMGTPTLQSIGAAQGLSLQLQPKSALDPKTSCGQSIQAVNAGNKQGMAVNAGTMMTASGQVIGASPKAGFPQQMMTASGKSTLIQSGFSPANANTLVIGQIGMMPNQQSIFSHKGVADASKGKTYTFQNQPTALQPKSLYSSAMPVNSSAQVYNSSHLKQISSQPQIITTQAPTNMFSQTQLLGLQTLSSLPPGLSWATSPALPSTALQFGQSPIIIRSQQSDMVIQQTPPQATMHLPVATQPVPPTSYTPSSIAPLKQKQVKVRPGTQTVAVATQTIVSTAATVNANSATVRTTQIKPKIRTSMGLSPGVSPSLMSPQMATTQTQTNQSPPQVPPQVPPHLSVTLQKSDAGNQTYSNQVKPLVTDIAKSPLTQSKSVSVDAKHLPSSPQKSQAMVAPSTKVPHLCVPPTVSVSDPLPTSVFTTLSTVTSTMATPTVSVHAAVSAVDAVPQTVSVAETMTMPVFSVQKVEEPKEGKAVHQKAMEVDVPPKPPPSLHKPPLGPVKDKQPQKAIVKPQVLTHVIDGLIIQEGPEPFPVSRSALLESPCRIPPTEKSDSHLMQIDSPPISSPDKKLKVYRPRGGPGRRKKIFRGRKAGNRNQASTDSSDAVDAPMDESGVSLPGEDSPLSLKTEEEEPSADSPLEMSVDAVKIDLENAAETDVARKLPTKWSVQEVFEFIQNVPGCSDYADTFRSQEIDGQALLLLKEDHLMTAMSMKLGPALKLISQIRGMKEELGLA